MFDAICIFLETGYTYTFREIKVTCDNETVFQFEYVAMSDGKPKRATFYKDGIAGISFTGGP